MHMVETLSGLWYFVWGWGKDDTPPAPAPTHRQRLKAPRLTCPSCLRQVAYSPALGRTARHLCEDGGYAQVAVPEVLDAPPQAR